ncbi:MULTISPECIES: hypothetical protein [Peptoniphilus]|uniref:hypothetical protein n=1 Tax=Peptoniphilus TaxID=162289 RepID=UPI000287B2AD|nr:MULTISPECIES: hypothetical protein [Peptoniphilus]MBS6610318.1 hypothetical protein [Peptoniphilus harei]MDU1043655.1 hypothetical protein [Peptoniphilus rhinitidis]MDU1954518.1 hypothetical protein [Peptoniphilus lacydonensis]MDU2109140.1 hypothetical protein [Peptoniphilus lacydonensis]MDU3750470.1 hypothetical protein [Peptoniphilus rhinitidis]
MSEKKLPWDNDSEAIKYVYVNPRKSFSEKYAYVITSILILLGIFTEYKLTLVLALLLLLSLLTKRYVAATPKGLEMYTDMKITHTYHIWDWSEIDAITYEKKPEEPKLILLYFTKGDVTKRFFFDERDKERVFDLAHKYNRKIKVYDAYEYKQDLKRFKKELKKTKRKWRK